ncbi:T9SS type A sorting domain-containing protein [Dyadobacter bucti]|uniref:T9SS type A sorting domain-containing protein n=1 Tax=Dyadobacter bucti TaxID=2572203 RepID=UPI0011098E66|nr:T9SS type A sorting domain-containing protein [Dyadobacter bucti]
MKTNLKFCIALLCLIPNVISAAIIYVNPSAAGSNNGSSWANAYTNLSTALGAAASGDEIWVKQGVYKPTVLHDVNGNGSTEAREATFKIPSGVTLYGGFAGTEVTRSQRNFQSNITVLSGDIDNNDTNVDGNSIAENTGQIVGNNAYHVIYTNNVTTSTRLDGFVVTAGKAMSGAAITDANQDGGAWYNLLNGATNASSPTIVNTTFQGNYAASEGGAFFCNAAAAGGAVTSLIQNCKFISNKSNVAGGAINIGSFSAGNYQPTIKKSEFSQNEAYRRGGAIYLIGDHAILDSTRFHANKVTAVSPDNSTLPGSGGGVGMVASNASFSNCFFIGNNTTGNPTGAFEGGGGGAVYMSANETQTNTLGISQPKFVNCGFYANVANGNTAAWGGAAVHLSDAGKLRPSYIGCVFSGNQAQDHGGAVASFARVMSAGAGYTPELTPKFTNCTFAGNHAGKNGGAVYNDGYVYMSSEILQSRIENSILWGNTAGTSGPQVSSSGANTVAYSLIQGSGGSGGGWNVSVGIDAGNNIDVSPGFANAADPDGADNNPGTSDDGLRPTATAAPVDKGNNAAAGLVGISKDYIGGARVQGSKVDMGAYERAGSVIVYPKVYWLKDWRIVRPACLNCPWAFIFKERIFEKFIWKGTAKLTDNGRTAVITGKIISRDNQNIGFDVYLKLINKHDWAAWSAKGRTYTTQTSASQQAALLSYKKWLFWELSSESYLKGIGDLSGTLALTHSPISKKTGFQLGTGANGWDADFGMSGSFNYKGTLGYKGTKYNLSAVASMNVDAGEYKLGRESMEAFSDEEDATESGDEPTITVYPNPVRDYLNIRPGTQASQFAVRLIRNNGSIAKELNATTSEGLISISVRGLTPGNYVLQLTGDDGKVENRKVLVVE